MCLQDDVNVSGSEPCARYYQQQQGPCFRSGSLSVSLCPMYSQSKQEDKEGIYGSPAHSQSLTESDTRGPALIRHMCCSTLNIPLRLVL